MISKNLSVKKLLTYQAVLIVIPLLLYGVSRFAGWLPTEEDWIARGSNHGPWRWEWQGLTPYLPLLILPITLLIAVSALIKKQPGFFLKMVGLGIVQFLLSLIPWLLLAWTVD